MRPCAPPGSRTVAGPARRRRGPGGGRGDGKRGSALAKARSLQDLYVGMCEELRVHPNSVVVGALPSKSPHLLSNEVLDLSRNYLGDRGLLALLPVIEQSTNLRSIILTENGLRNHATRALCNVLLTHPGVRLLDLSDNYISVGAADALIMLARENPHIEVVRLDNTKLDVAHRVAIRAALSNKVSTTAANTVAATNVEA